MVKWKFFLLIDFSSMADGNDSNDEATILDLVNNPVIADTDAVGIASF